GQISFRTTRRLSSQAGWLKMAHFGSPEKDVTPRRPVPRASARRTRSRAFPLAIRPRAGTLFGRDLGPIMEDRRSAEYEARIAELTGEVAALHASLRHAGAALHFVNWLRDRRRRM